MRLVSTADLKNRTSEVLRAALAGEPVVVTRHGWPVVSLTRLVEGDLETLAAGGPGVRRPGSAAGRTLRATAGGARGPYGYAAFPQPFGTFFLAFGPRGPAYARLASSAEAFERDARRYLGASVQRQPAPPGLARAVADAIRRGRPYAGRADLARVGPFEREVLAAVRRIPRGQVMTYRAIAQALGQPGAARAVGAACARNPLPLLIPCHRVVRSDGSLGGYSLRGGVVLKRRLLEGEGALSGDRLPRAARRAGRARAAGRGSRAVRARRADR